MLYLKKIFSAVAILFILTMTGSSVAKASSILDDIKSKLESEGIEVVDYSTQEGNWGALTSEWISLLTEAGYTSLEELAEVYENHFSPDGITEKRRQLAIAEAQKTRLTLTNEIADKNKEIATFQKELDQLMNNLQNELAKEVLDFDFEALKIEKTDEKVEEGINLLAKEIDFYFNYNKWGPLPLRIVGVLEQIKNQDGPKYKDLQDMANQHKICSSKQTEIEAGMNEIETFFSKIENLTSQDVELIKNSVIIACAKGEAQINKIAQSVASAIQNIAGGMAVLWIVVAGVRMIFARGDETAISEQKNAILYGIIGLVVILLVGRMIDILYGPAGVNRTELSTEGTAFSDEVYGIVSFIKAIIGILAILFIVMSGVRTIFAQGEEAEITNQRKSILWIGAGLVLLAINEIIIKNLFIVPTQEQSDRLQSSNIAAVIATLSNVIKFLLGFVGLVTLGILIYGAATMIMNYGDPEMVEKSKKIIKNALIGIVIILSSYVIVATLVVFG